jgi:hypothetical protein
MSHVDAESAAPASHFRMSSHIKHGTSMSESILTRRMVARSRCVHRPLESSRSRVINFLPSRLSDIREPSRLVAPNSRHRSRWRIPSSPLSIINFRARFSKSSRLGNSFHNYTLIRYRISILLKCSVIIQSIGTRLFLKYVLKL